MREEPGSTASPYPGLRPFDLNDAEYFFGREAQIAALLERLSTRAFVAVIGSSGSGKSSLVRAGLLPQLKRASAPSWTTWVMRPESTPFENLARKLDGASDEDMKSTEAVLRRSRLVATLNRSSSGLIEAVRDLGYLDSDQQRHFLLVVDQFEELIRYDQEALDTSLNFVRLLLSTVQQREIPIHVMITLRLDFLGDCARYPGLTEVINEGQYLVPALDRFERADAIQKPAELAGKHIAWPLLQTLLNEADDAQDQLPVLQHCLMRLWEVAGDAETITEAHYQDSRIGSLDQALANHANALFDALSRDQQDLAKRLFKAVTDLDKLGRGVRRSTRVAPLIASLDLQPGPDDREGVPKALVEVVDHFRGESVCFLLPPKSEQLTLRSTVDITHESLIRLWPRISGDAQSEGWLQEEEHYGRKFVQVVDDALDHKLDGKPAYEGSQLAELTGWWRRWGYTAGWGMRYIHGSLLKRLLAAIGPLPDTPENDQHARNQAVNRLIDEFVAAGRRLQQRAKLQTNLIKAASAIFACVLLAVGAWGADQYYEHLKSSAESEQLRDALAAASAARMDAESKQLQLEQKVAELTRAREATDLAQAGQRVLGSSSVSSSVERLLATGDNVSALLMARRGLLLTARGKIADELPLRRAAYRAISQIREQGVFVAGESIYRMALAADSRHLATADFSLGAAASVSLWDLYDPSRPLWRGGLSGGPAGGTCGIVFSPDGGRLAIVTEYGAIAILLASDGRLLWERPASSTAERLPILCGYDLAFSPDGRTLAVTQPEAGKLLLVSDDGAATREVVLPGTAALTSLDYLSNASLLVAGDMEGWVSIVALDEPKVLDRQRVQGGPVTALHVSPDDHYLASASSDNRSVVVSEIDNKANKVVRQLLTRSFDNNVLNVRWDENGQRLGIAMAGKALILDSSDHWNTTGETTAPIGERPLGDIAFASTEQTILTADSLGLIRVWPEAKVGTKMPRVADSDRWTTKQARMDFQRMPMSGKGSSCGTVMQQQQQQLQLTSDPSGDRDNTPCLDVLSEDSRITAQIDRAGLLTVWSDFDILFEWQLSLRTVQALALAPDGTEVAVLNTSGEVLVWPILNDAGSLLVLLNRFVPLGAVSADEDDNTLAIDPASIMARLLSPDDRALLDQLASGTIGQKPPAGPR